MTPDYLLNLLRNFRAHVLKSNPQLDGLTSPIWNEVEKALEEDPETKYPWVYVERGLPAIGSNIWLLRTPTVPSNGQYRKRMVEAKFRKQSWGLANHYLLFEVSGGSYYYADTLDQLKKSGILAWRDR